MHVERFGVPAAALPADANIRYQYPIHRGQWIVHPEIHPREDSFCRYQLTFDLPAAATLELHVSADQRFELCCDGTYVGMGPDRSDIAHWSFHAYRLVLEAGRHCLSADVHYLYQSHPVAQISREPGFVLYAADAPVILDTGRAPWKVQRLAGIRTERAAVRGYFVVGPNYVIDAAHYFTEGAWVDAVVLCPAGTDGGSGRIEPGWRLYPSGLPEQLLGSVKGGVIRVVASGLAEEAPFPSGNGASHPQWQALVDGCTALEIAPHTRVTALWDLAQYHTAYPQLTVQGGTGSRVKIEWAESCFLPPDETEADRRPRVKGDRNAVTGKVFAGYGDTFLPDGGERTFRPFWWRAGRYVRIMVETQADPLTLQSLQLQETRFPVENEGDFGCSDPQLDEVIAVAVRGIQMCAHETYMDCPYYEQLMYVGDTRLQMLTAYVMSPEDRLNQRGIALFDWSRRETGFVLERYPSAPLQLSATFSMIWVLMVRDQAWWRDDPVFVRDCLKGVRCLLEEFKAHQGTQALLPALPGWSFMDWVPGLSAVNPPGPDAGVSAVINLLFLQTLLAAADLEAHFGEAHLAEHNRAWAAQLAAAVEARFWNEARGLFAEDVEHTRFSEHAQCLALLSGLFPARQERCFAALLQAEDLLRTTVYFSFYLLEVFQRFGRGDLILKKFDFWKEMVQMGFKTPVEMPEPSRSDCHAWGSHPLFHMHASLAGIRPAGPGFRRVLITPSPGTLQHLHSRIPHPRGEVFLQMEKHGARWEIDVVLPEGVTGTLAWQGQRHPLSPGRQQLSGRAGDVAL